MSQKKKLWATIALLLTAAIWGSAFVFQKFAVDELSTSFIIASRFTIAGVLTAIATIKKWHRIDKGYLLGGFVAGTTMALGTGLQTVAMTFGTTPGKSAFLTAAYCVIVPFLCWLFLKEKPKRNHIISAAICLLGIGFISLDGNLRITFGDGVTLLCSAVFAGNIVSIAYFCRGRDPMVLTMVQICVAAIWGWISVVATGGMPQEISMAAIGNVLYLAIFSTALCLSLQSVGLKYINATVGTILLSLEAVFGVIFSVLLCGEVITLKIAFGFIIVFVAVILSQLDFIRPSREKTAKNTEN
ncbi:DMT family transporter [Anaerotignum sp.]|uniref:DMT family transporter n=1 Tax=Anaerotignum sp. TaxID=2039241 RepID=UPI0028A6C3A5|nr:DMT family transporter [Anaerotignum sp.]